VAAIIQKAPVGTRGITRPKGACVSVVKKNIENWLASSARYRVAWVHVVSFLPVVTGWYHYNAIAV
jgi:hypothetical protein